MYDVHVHVRTYEPTLFFLRTYVRTCFDAAAIHCTASPLLLVRFFFMQRNQTHLFSNRFFSPIRVVLVLHFGSRPRGTRVCTERELLISGQFVYTCCSCDRLMIPSRADRSLEVCFVLQPARWCSIVVLWVAFSCVEIDATMCAAPRWKASQPRDTVVSMGVCVSYALSNTHTHTHATLAPPRPSPLSLATSWCRVCLHKFNRIIRCMPPTTCEPYIHTYIRMCM